MKHIEWGFLIVNYLFAGGLSAGLFFVSAVVLLLRRDGSLDRVARWGAILAPWPVALGCGLLVLDLGRWYAAYKLFLHFRWTSPMSIGSWLLLLFLAVSFAYFYTWVPAEARERIFFRMPARLRFLSVLNRDFSEWRRPLALAGVPLSAGVGIYTGVLLGAVQSRPFWNTNLVAQLFLFSAFSTGCAALILLLSAGQKNIDANEFRFLYSLDLGLLTLELFVVVPYVLHGTLSVQAVRDSLGLILGGPFTVMFWGWFFLLGLLVPLFIEAFEVLPAVTFGTPFHATRKLAVVTAALILCGGFLLRYIFVFAGQASSIR